MFLRYVVLACVLLVACSRSAVAPEAPSPPAVETPPPAPAPIEKPAEQPPPAVEYAWKLGGIGMPLVTEKPELKDKKVAMLTFDDGPTGEFTPQILDILKEHKIRALWFVTGYGAKNEELIKRIHREGHVLGTHTTEHQLLTELGVEQMRQAIVPVNETVERLTGYRPRYFRPPHGAYNDALRNLLNQLGMHLVNWSVGSLDWHGVRNGYKDPELVVADTMSQMHAGAVILFHDTLRHTVEALPKIIAKLQAEGYEFVVLEP